MRITWTTETVNIRQVAGYCYSEAGIVRCEMRAMLPAQVSGANQAGAFRSVIERFVAVPEAVNQVVMFISSVGKQKINACMLMLQEPEESAK